VSKEQLKNEDVGGAKWYLVRVYSGSEEIVVKQIKDNSSLRGVSSFFADFFIPKVNLQPLDPSQPSEKPKKPVVVFPGYIAVKMVLDEVTWHLVKSIPKVSGFLGSGNENKYPQPVPQSDIDVMLNAVSKVASKSEKVLFEVGESVRVKNGSFSGFKGNILSISSNGKDVILLVPVFNTETEVNATIDDIEKLSTNS